MSPIRALGARREGFNWPLPDAEPPYANTTYINTLSTWGHSYFDSIISGDPNQIPALLFSALGIQWPLAQNYGAGGTTITGDWPRYMQTMQPAQLGYGGSSWTAALHPMAFLHGFNDVTVYGDPTRDSNQALNAWTNVWRAVLAWSRAGAMWPPDWTFGGSAYPEQPTFDAIAPWNKAGVTYAGAWTTGITAPTGPSPPSVDWYAPHRTFHWTTSTSATVDIRLPPRHPGTPVTLYVAGEVGATGATSVTVSNPGGAMASFTVSTNNRVRTPTYQVGGSARRTIVPITVTLPPGNGSTSQTLRLAPTAYAGGGRFTFFGWSIEAIHPPIMVVANIPTTAQPSFGDPLITQAQFASYCTASYNPAVVTVADEFLPAGSVAVADLAGVLSGLTNPEYYGPSDLGSVDLVHPNSGGRQIVAKEFLEAMNRTQLDMRHLIAHVNADQMALGAASLSQGSS